MLMSSFVLLYLISFAQILLNILYTIIQYNYPVLQKKALFYKTFFSLKRGSVMYDSYLLKDVHSVLVNFPREYAQESMMLYI